jgi:hypothetical protein
MRMGRCVQWSESGGLRPGLNRRSRTMTVKAASEADSSLPVLLRALARIRWRPGSRVMAWRAGEVEEVGA